MTKVTDEKIDKALDVTVKFKKGDRVKIKGAIFFKDMYTITLILDERSCELNGIYYIADMEDRLELVK